MSLVTLAELNDLLAAHAFTRRLGAEVVSVGDGACTLAVPHHPEHLRPGGIVSGPIYMHAADVAFWLAVKTRLGLDDPSVTSSLNTAFLGTARRASAAPPRCCASAGGSSTGWRSAPPARGCSPTTP